MVDFAGFVVCACAAADEVSGGEDCVKSGGDKGVSRLDVFAATDIFDYAAVADAFEYSLHAGADAAHRQAEAGVADEDDLGGGGLCGGDAACDCAVPEDGAVWGNVVKRAFGDGGGVAERRGTKGRHAGEDRAVAMAGREQLVLFKLFLGKFAALDFLLELCFEAGDVLLQFLAAVRRECKFTGGAVGQTGEGEDDALRKAERQQHEVTERVGVCGRGDEEDER